MQWKNKLKRINWSDVAWYTMGYILLAFLTILFSLACYMGRQMAAVNLLIYSTVLLFLLPPHKR